MQKGLAAFRFVRSVYGEPAVKAYERVTFWGSAIAALLYLAGKVDDWPFALVTAMVSLAFSLWTLTGCLVVNARVRERLQAAERVIEAVKVEPDREKYVIDWMIGRKLRTKDLGETNYAKTFWNYWPSLQHGLSADQWAFTVTGLNPDQDAELGDGDREWLEAARNSLVFFAAMELMEYDKEVSAYDPHGRYFVTQLARDAFRRINLDPAFLSLTQ